MHVTLYARVSTMRQVDSGLSIPNQLRQLRAWCETNGRVQELKVEREYLLVELAGVRRNLAVPVERVLPSNIEAFTKAIRRKVRDKDFAKWYLQALVDEIVVDGDSATLKGSYAKLANAIAKMKKGTS